jgi:hypothetical protein
VVVETERPPYESYAAIVGTFAGLLATAGALGRGRGGPPVGPPVGGRGGGWGGGRPPPTDFLQAGFAALTSKAD